MLDRLNRVFTRILLLAGLGLAAGFLALAIAVPIEPQVIPAVIALFSPGLKLAEFITPELKQAEPCTRMLPASLILSKNCFPDVESVIVEPCCRIICTAIEVVPDTPLRLTCAVPVPA